MESSLDGVESIAWRVHSMAWRVLLGEFTRWPCSYEEVIQAKSFEFGSEQEERDSKFYIS